jgi:SAM-dependent methyltransferase
MLFSVFTASDNPRFLDSCYESLRAQTLPDWEWIVSFKRGSKEWRPTATDERVKIVRSTTARRGGEAKREACDRASGEVLVELDPDDMLAPTCLEDLRTAFAEHPDTVLAYSDWTQINEDGSRDDDRFDEAAGWRYSEVEIGGTTYLRCHALQPYPHNLGYIWYAPNHVRAFRRTAYEGVGGYDSMLDVLDDQDLMTRLYVAGPFRHVDRCLYLQRVRQKTTQRERSNNARIQEQTVRNYDASIGSLATAWSRRQGLAVVTLVTDTSPPIVDTDPGDIVVIDPSDPAVGLDADSVGVIKAVELLQRVPERTTLFNECYRVLAHGGLLISETPSTEGRGAFQDPSHVAFYNENSFWYLTQAALFRSLPHLRSRFQVSRIQTYYPSDWHEEAKVPYVEANLLAIKDGPRQGGALLC